MLNLSMLLLQGDIRALDDLTYEKWKEFVIKHKLPEEVPIVSFHTEASVAPGVLSTIYHIAHVELPWLPLPCFSNDELDSGQVGRKVPVVIPLAAAMAICALHLRLRYGEKSDGLVTCRDAEVRGSVVVQPDQKLDHVWISSGKKDTDDPDAFEMWEALFTLLVEIGNAKQERVEGQFMPLYPLAGLCHLLACTFLVFVENSSADIHFLRYGAFCNG